MAHTPDQYAGGAEVLVVGLARTGDRGAFAELVRRRQSWVRKLMHRCCGDAVLADDLAQKAFLLAWRKIATLRDPDRFGPWLKRLAVNTWLQHARKHDALRDAGELDPIHPEAQSPAGMAVDLDGALATLPGPVRLCIVLSYQEGMTHAEIAKITALPLGTVKSHIRRGTATLRCLLAAYSDAPDSENIP